MRTLCLSLLLVLPVTGRAQRPAPARPAFTAAGAFFALSVADLDVSARWYEEKLGLTRTMTAPRREGAAVVVLEGGGLVVELVQLDSARALQRIAPSARGPQDVHGFFKAGVIVDDFDRALAELRARGVEIAYGPFPPRAGQRANVIVRDGAGNLLQLFGR